MRQELSEGETFYQYEPYCRGKGQSTSDPIDTSIRLSKTGGGSELLEDEQEDEDLAARSSLLRSSTSLLSILQWRSKRLVTLREMLQRGERSAGRGTEIVPGFMHDRILNELMQSRCEDKGTEAGT